MGRDESVIGVENECEGVVLSALDVEEDEEVEGQH